MSLAAPSIAGLIIWCILPPLGILGLTIHAHTRDLMTSPEFYQMFWPLYYPFKMNNSFFLPIKLFSFLLFQSTHAAFRSDTLQMTAGILVLLVELTLIAWRRPWIEEFTTYIHFIASGGVIAFLVFAKDTTTVPTSSDSFNNYDPILTTTITLSAVVVGILLAVATIVPFFLQV
ncbi:hypothetical protein BC829DRAFT_254260 [Chytridium lagenaria]|nr:hypothetical protein BC829DRAFT_254260 [Chytridium lagenaria]